MEKCHELLRINEEISALYALEIGTISQEQVGHLFYLRQERDRLERDLGDQVEGLKGYRGGPG